MPSPNVSNGTCYFGINNQTKGDFVPCGNIAFGDWPCCALGDSCLGFESANACYDPDSGNAYMAGCTDQSYVDKTCPQKLGFKDQEWVGLNQCGTESNGDKDWGGCKVDPANATDLFKLPNANCDDYCSTTLWIGSANIPSFAVLPTTTGGSITWISNFNPTSTSRPPGTPGIATPTATQATSEPSRGLSAGAKAGIGAGCSVAALFILGLFLWCCLTRRRKSRQNPNAQEQTQAAAQYTYPPTYHSGNYSAAPSPMTATIAASPTGYDQQWSHSTIPPKSFLVAGAGNDTFTGFKNELPANEIRPLEMASPSIHQIIPASPTGHNIPQADSDASGGIAHHQRHDVVGGYYLSPQSTGSENNHIDEPEHTQRHHPSEMQG